MRASHLREGIPFLACMLGFAALGWFVSKAETLRSEALRAQAVAESRTDVASPTWKKPPSEEELKPVEGRHYVQVSGLDHPWSQLPAITHFGEIRLHDGILDFDGMRIDCHIPKGYYLTDEDCALTAAINYLAACRTACPIDHPKRRRDSRFDFHDPWHAGALKTVWVAP